MSVLPHIESRHAKHLQTMHERYQSDGGYLRAPERYAQRVDLEKDTFLAAVGVDPDMDMPCRHLNDVSVWYERFVTAAGIFSIICAVLSGNNYYVHYPDQPVTPAYTVDALAIGSEHCIEQHTYSNGRTAGTRSLLQR